MYELLTQREHKTPEGLNLQKNRHEKQKFRLIKDYNSRLVKIALSRQKVER